MRGPAALRSVVSALVAAVLAVMLLSHCAPVPTDHGALSMSAQSLAHVCDDLSRPEEAAGHYWTRVSDDPAQSQASGGAPTTSGIAVTSAMSARPDGCATSRDSAARRSAASQPCVLQVFRC